MPADSQPSSGPQPRSDPQPDRRDPVEALQRIAYLLERQRADTYRVRAFRRAAEALRRAGPERVDQLHRSGHLADLPGVGSTTAQIAAEALDGQVPPYLEELESQPASQLSAQARIYRDALAGDCHSHSDWSDGGSSIREMAEAAAALGHDYLVLTDHSPRLTVAHGLDAARLRQQLEVVAELNRELSPFRILTGIEVDILEDGTLDQDPDLLAELDLVVASVHSKLSMEASLMTARMLRAIESPHTDVLGHCTGRKIAGSVPERSSGRGRKPSSFDAAAVFSACAETGTAVEINSRPERRDPPPDLLRAAIEAGCLFSIDTDAHAPGQLEWLDYGCEQAAEADVPPDRVVNSWTGTQLLAWTADRAVPA